MNSGCFIKGEKRVNQGNRGLGKVTVKTREAIQAFTDTNAHKLQIWLDEIHQKDGPKAAFECYTRLLVSISDQNFPPDSVQFFPFYRVAENDFYYV